MLALLTLLTPEHPEHPEHCVLPRSGPWSRGRNTNLEACRLLKREKQRIR